MAVLVLGGAGYIGSVTVEQLVRSGRKVVVYDNLSTGHREAVEPTAVFVEGDIGDSARLEKTVRELNIQNVMHFCAHSVVDQSVKDPLRYYQNNVQNGIRLLATLQRCGVKQFIFSSSAAVYGEPATVPVDENAPTNPMHPYGRTKRMFEEILGDCSAAGDLHCISLRYFNACGATPKCGEDHRPETHLIPIVLEVAAGKREALSVYGRDYPTPDGTCIRDYIHVSDLAEAHVRALTALERGAATTVYNLGNGHGFSVLEVVQAVEEITARKIPIHFVARRPGDPARLVAASSKIHDDLHWYPQITDLRRIIETVWQWRQEHPHGYAPPPAAQAPVEE